jgi:hypothetical protein
MRAPRSAPAARSAAPRRSKNVEISAGGAEVRKLGVVGLRQRYRARLPEWVTDRDRGEPRGSAPPTPPYVRVRIRRFEKLS